MLAANFGLVLSKLPQTPASVLSCMDRDVGSCVVLTRHLVVRLSPALTWESILFVDPVRWEEGDNEIDK